MFTKYSNNLNNGIWYRGGEKGKTNASLGWWQEAGNVKHSHLQQP